MRLARSTIYVLAVATSFLGVVACGGGDDDDGGTITGDHHTYVVSSVTVPDEASESDQYSYDFDGDGDVDNQLGDVLIALRSAAGAGSFDIQGSVDEAVNHGDILLLADVQSTALDNAGDAGLRVFYGANANPAPCLSDTDTVCGQHLAGGASFEVASDSPTDAAIAGDIVNARFTGGPGNLALAIAFSGTVIKANLIEARAELTGISATGITSGKVAGGISDEELQTEVMPAVWMTLTDILARDCTDATATNCGCADGSTGATLLSIFGNELEDCMMTLDELKANPLVSSLLRPDLDTDGDGTKDALSLGVGVTAVAGTYTVPE